MSSVCTKWNRNQSEDNIIWWLYMLYLLLCCSLPGCCFCMYISKWGVLHYCISSNSMYRLKHFFLSYEQSCYCIIRVIISFTKESLFSCKHQWSLKLKLILPICCSHVTFQLCRHIFWKILVSTVTGFGWSIWQILKIAERHST